MTRPLASTEMTCAARAKRSECSARAAARCAAARLGTDVVGVDEWPRVSAGRLRAAPLLGLPRFRWRRETRNLDLELAPVACGQFFGLRIEWLTGDRAHGTEATPGHRLTNARLPCVAARAERKYGGVDLRTCRRWSAIASRGLRSTDLRMFKEGLRLGRPPWRLGLPGVCRNLRFPVQIARQAHQDGPSTLNRHRQTMGLDRRRVPGRGWSCEWSTRGGGSRADCKGWAGRARSRPQGRLREGPCSTAARHPSAARTCGLWDFRNEARYLAEWVTFHQLMGAERFWRYDNLSADDWQSALAPDWIPASSP